MLTRQLEFRNVWRQDVPVVRDKVLQFWQDLKVNIKESPEERVKQLVYVVLKDNEVAGVSTAYKEYFNPLQNHFYFFRCLIHPQYRMPGLVDKILVATRDFLEEYAATEVHEKPKGLMTIVENPALRERNEAVWPSSKMIYIGKTTNGLPLRLYYFKGAMI